MDDEFAGQLMMAKEKVVIAEPRVRRQHPNIGLLKIGAYYLRQGHTVAYARGTVSGLPFVPDRICISAIFTYYSEKAIRLIRQAIRLYPNANVQVGGVYPSLLPHHVKEHTGVEPHVGLLHAVEAVPPAYSLVPEGDPFSRTSLVFTSRGCGKSCKFCAVTTLEPEMGAVDGWPEHVSPDHKRVVVYDNNISVQPAAHRGLVFEFFARTGQEVLFDNGFDCTRFDDVHADEVASINHQNVRFALDNVALIESVESAVQRVVTRGISKSKIQVYVIYNFNDTVADTVARCESLIRLGVRPYPQVYRPFSQTGSRDYFVSPGWTLGETRRIRYFFTIPTLYQAGSYWAWKKAGCPTLRGSKVNFFPEYDRTHRAPG